MSRIGKQPIPVPDKVSVVLGEGEVQVKGPKGELRQVIPSGVSLKQEGSEIIVSRDAETNLANSRQGLVRSLVANMVTGVTTGFSKKLIINGVGYRVEQKGPQWLLFVLGYSHPILYELAEGLSVTIDNKENSVTISGYNKQVVGAAAAEIRGLRPPEPYKGKGVRYADEQLLRKEGKAGGK